MTTPTNTVVAAGGACGRPALSEAEITRRECGHWIGAERRHCKEVDGVRRYITGWCCPTHTPRALRGLPEFPPGPGIPAASLPLSPISASHLYDERAIASGRRRSSPHVYRAAQAAVAKKKEGRA